jgi:hypothetical protein
MVRYRNTSLLTPKQYVQDYPGRQRTAEWLLPIIAEKSRVANDFLPEKFWQYNLLRYRKCSCYNGEQDPDAMCNACFGCGYLPGYTPEGYLSYVTLDVSTPGLILNNVIPDFSSATNPVPLVLADTALDGYAESTFEACSPNLGKISSIFYSGSNQSEGLTLEYSLDGDVWKPLVEDFDQQLEQPPKGIIKFRAFFHRTNITDPKPFLRNILLRIQVAEDPLIKMDVPRLVANIDSADAGLIPLLAQFNAFADFKTKIEKDTIFVHQRSKRKFKVLSLNPNMPDGILTSWDIQLRLIQPDEPLNRLV